MRNELGQFVKGYHGSRDTEFKKGFKHTDEWKNMMKERMKGNTKGFKKGNKINLGRTHTEKTKEIIGEKNRGPKHTEESKEKIRRASIKRWENPEYRKKILGKIEKSSLEIKFEEICKKNNLPYRFVGNGDLFIERKCPDFVNCNGEKIAIEVFYRRHKEEFREGLDKWKEDRTNIFNKYGWKLHFFNETQVNEENVIKVLGG